MHIMNDIKVPQPENGSFSDSTVNHHSERDIKDEQISVKENKSENFGFFAMSALQKFFFIFSLLLSVLYIVVFAWLIPCKKIQPPISNSTNIQVDEKWKINLQGLSITSNLEAIKLLDSNEYLMMFGYSSSVNQITEFGVVAFSAIDGKILWQRPTLVLPKYCKCDVLDLNLDNMKECIIIGERGYISVINASDGKEYWHKQESYEFEIASIPALITDYDNDGISDLVVAFSTFTSMEDLKNNNPVNVIFRILSGKNGIIIGSDINIQQCSTSIDKVILWKKYLSSDVVFYCSDDERIGNLWSISTEKIGFMAISHQNSNVTEFEKILKLEQSTKKQYKILYHQVQKENMTGQDILVSLNDGDIALLDSISGRKKWIKRFDNHDNIKAVLTGQFNNLDNIGIIISSNYTLGTSIISFHLNNGSEIKNLNYQNYFVASALLLPGAFNGNDGIILQHINISSKYFEETPLIQNSLDKSQNNAVQKKIHFQEEYLITNCIYYENMESVAKSQVTRLCYQNTSCLSEIYTDFPTAFVSKSDDNSYKLILATTSVISPLQESYESTVVELLDLHLKNFSYDNSTNYSCYN